MKTIGLERKIEMEEATTIPLEKFQEIQQRVRKAQYDRCKERLGRLFAEGRIVLSGKDLFNEYTDIKPGYVIRNKYSFLFSLPDVRKTAEEIMAKTSTLSSEQRGIVMIFMQAVSRDIAFTEAYEKEQDEKATVQEVQATDGVHCDRQRNDGGDSSQEG